MKVYEDKIMKYLTLFVLMVVSVFICINIAAYAEDDYIASGEYTTYLASDREQTSVVKWSLDKEGHLVITGSGDSYDVANKPFISESGRVYEPDWPWKKYKENIISVTLNLTDFSNASFMFTKCSNLKSFDFADTDTSNLLSMYRIFYQCSSLVSIDFKNLDTSNVQHFGDMLAECSSLRKVSLANFDFSGIYKNEYYLSQNSEGNIVYALDNILRGCDRLREADLSFDASGLNPEGTENIRTNIILYYLTGLKKVMTPRNSTLDCPLYFYNFRQDIIWFDENGYQVPEIAVADYSFECILPKNDPETHIYHRYTAELDYEHRMVLELAGGNFKEYDVDTLVDSESKSGIRFIYDDEPIGELPVPERDGYEFEGWYTEKEGGVPVDTTSNYIAGQDITVYAHWKSNNVMVTFETTGGVSFETQRMVTIGKPYGVLPVPEKYGIEFEGWYLDKNYKNIITEESLVEATTDHILYAKWKEAEASVPSPSPSPLPLPAPVPELMENEDIHVLIKQKYDVSGYFKDISGIKKYKAFSENGGKAVVNKNGILTAKKPGKIIITPYIKQGKKLVASETRITIFVDKADIQKKVVLNKERSEIVLNDLFNIGKEYKTMYAIFSMNNNCISMEDFNNGHIKANCSGSAKLILNVYNAQGRYIKYKINIKSNC